MTEEIAEMTISFRKEYTIKLPDVVIAATAYVHGFTLLTRNIKDFTRVKDLKLKNLFDEGGF